MFDKEFYYTQPSKQEVTIHQHQAPTPESARLYHELREEVQKDLKFELSSMAPNKLKFEVVSQSISMTCTREVLLAFELNGIKYCPQVDITYAELQSNPQKVIEVLFDQISKVITKELLKLCANDLIKKGNLK